MKEKCIRNFNLYWRWKTGNYSIRSISRMFKISHIRARQIIQKEKKEEEKYEKEYKNKKQKKYCHRKIMEFIKKGVIKKSKVCENCKGITDTVAHHENYLKPSEIVWLCRSCHKQRHIELKQGN